MFQPWFNLDKVYGLHHNEGFKSQFWERSKYKSETFQYALTLGLSTTQYPTSPNAILKNEVFQHLSSGIGIHRKLFAYRRGI